MAQSNNARTYNRQIAIERRQADADWRKLCKLSPNQLDLLRALSHTQWRRPPLQTGAATILSLVDRGLIDISCLRYPYTRYSDADMKLTPSGKAVRQATKSIRYDHRGMLVKR